MKIGWRTPSAIRICSTSSGVAMSDSMSVAGSPGTTRRITNEISRAPARTTRLWTARRSRYLPISPSQLSARARFGQRELSIVTILNARKWCNSHTARNLSAVIGPGYTETNVGKLLDLRPPGPHGVPTRNQFHAGRWVRFHYLEQRRKLVDVEPPHTPEERHASAAVDSSPSGI